MKKLVDLLVPELQRRGVFKCKYSEGTLRERLGARAGAHAPVGHPTAPHGRNALPEPPIGRTLG